MKYNLLSIFFLLGLICLLVGQTNSKWIHFDWHGETIYGKHFDKVAIGIPLKVENMPYNFCGQFDLDCYNNYVIAKFILSVVC
ncbi:MAG: hypothetical protein R2822_26340 [Spirosomataceae bacterium]